MKLKFDYLSKCVMLLLAFIAFGNFALAQRTVTGTVTDAETGEALIGANVLVLGTSTGTVTDFDGNFELQVPDGTTTLEISYTGYSSQQIDITNQSRVTVQLSAGQALEEIVVVGYGTQRQKEITSAITSLDEEDFNQGTINNPAQLLQGKVAGLSIARPGGDPNGGFNIRLRGLSTVGANTSPLIIIDGVVGADFATVDPNDIASISVLKDGSAASIYGTRASSGVIIVTTKRGRSGTSVVDYNGQFAVETIDRTVDVMDAATYRQFIKDRNIGTDFGANTDWFDELTETGLSQIHNLSLSGGTQKTSYRASVNFRDVDGVAINTGFKQLNGRLNLSQKAINDRLNLSLNVTATRREADFGFSEAFRYATIYNPTAPVRSSDPEFDQYEGYFQKPLFDFYNPVAIMEQNTNKGVNNSLILNGQADFEIIDGLFIGMNYAEQSGTNLRNVYWDKNSYLTGQGRNGLAQKREDANFSRLFETTGRFNQDFGNLGFEALVGYSFQDFQYEGFFAEGGDFLTDLFGYDRLQASFDFKEGLGNVTSYRNANRLIAFFGRVNFNVNDTYFLQAAVRREGSSRFGADNKWGWFPGVSAGVTLSNLMNTPGIDNLKLRVGYGVTGANVGSSYISLPKLAQQDNFFYYRGNYIPVFAPASNPNPDLKWETKTDYSVGLDFAFLDYKLTGALDYYNTTTKDMAFEFNVPVPPNVFPTTVVNVGELNNSGIELSLSYAAIQTPRFSWTPSIATNYFFETELVSLSTETFDFGGFRDIANLGSPGQNDTPLIRVEEGKPVGQIWGLVYEGIDDRGNWIFKDVDGDGVQGVGDIGDRTVIGDGLPDYQIGLTNYFTLGNFDLNIFFRGVFGHDLVNTFRAFYETPGAAASYNILASVLDNTAALSNSTNAAFSSLHVENASFVKLDNATLGYRFNLPQGGAFRNIRLYVSGQNLFTITNYTGVDPEVRFSDDNNPLAPGIDRRNTYFRTKTVTVGLNVGF